MSYLLIYNFNIFPQIHNTDIIFFYILLDIHKIVSTTKTRIIVKQPHDLKLRFWKNIILFNKKVTETLLSNNHKFGTRQGYLIPSMLIYWIFPTVRNIMSNISAQ